MAYHCTLSNITSVFQTVLIQRCSNGTYVTLSIQNLQVGKLGKVKENGIQLSMAATNSEGQKISEKWAFGQCQPTFSPLLSFLFIFYLKVVWLCVLVIY